MSVLEVYFIYIYIFIYFHKYFKEPNFIILNGNPEP